ncbi:MAG: TonB-dependent receptor [Acidobacteria bacterium]|nr:TonB-dependent receptor [Acidobacteriota bacterium]
MRKKAVLAILTAIFSAGLYAQEYRATITGTVTDPSGAAIPNASVKAVNSATNSTHETKTSGDGVYTLPLLEPGVYRVDATAAGFQTLSRTSITLAVGQRLNLPMQLAVGQASTEITVTGQQEVIQSADASRGLVFDPIKTQEYPLNGRQSYMLLSLTPGVIFGQEQFGASGFSGTRGWDVNNSYKFNGARQGNGNNVFMMNGTAISNESSTWEFAPSVDAIQEFSAMTTVYDAQYGHEAGGVVNTVIRGGTNNWHGTIYDYFRNAVLDANNFGNNYAGAKKGNHQQNQFGGTFGGPIRKDNDFVFMSYEGWQEIIPFPGAGQQTVPVDLRNGQNFSKYNMAVYDPLTTHPCTAGTGTPDTEPCGGSNGSAYWRNPFPGNVIPANRISPVATKILSYLPAPNAPGQGAAGITSNYVNAANTGRYWYNQPIVRWDHNFGSRNKFYALFSEFHGYEYRSTSTFPKPLAQGNIDNNRTFTGLNLDDTHVLSPTTVLDVKLSYFRFTQLTPGYSDLARAISAQSIGMTNMIHAPTVPDSVIPNIYINAYTGPLFGSGSYSWSPYNRWIFTPSVSMTKGTHSLHFGFEYNMEARGNVNPGQAYGVFTFDNSLTRRATDRTLNQTDQFLSVATLLLGMPTSGNIANNASYYISRPYYAWYAQDDWKVTNRLTVNIGLRYEFQLAYLERYNRMSSMFDINTVNPLSDKILAVWRANKAAYDATNPKYPYPAPPAALYGVWRFGGVDGYPRRTHYTDFTTGAPRIGFAYRLGEKTVIRGGAGVFYQSDTATNNDQTGFSQSTGYISSFNVNGSPMPSACFNDLNGFSGGGCQTGAPTGPYSLVNPFPQGTTAAIGPAAGLLANVGQGSNSNPLHYKTPRTYQYSLGVQRQLPHAMIIDISFAGNYALYDRDGQDYGHLQNAAGYTDQQIAMNDPTYFSRPLANPFYQILPTTTSRGSSPTASASSLENAYAVWGGYTQADVADRNFRSDGFQLRFEKKAMSDKGGVLTWVTSYTWSKQYSRTCCVGQSWAYNQGAVLQLSPNGQTGTLAQYPYQGKDANLVYAPDSANKYHELAFSGVWDLPIGKGKYFGNGVTGAADKIISGWRADWILSYISGNLIGLPGGINYCGNYVNYTDPSSGQVVHNEDHWYNNNPSCYANFPSNAINSQLPPRFSNVTNPAAPQLNVAVAKDTSFGERYKLQFRAESFNLTNTAIRPGPISGTFTAAGFGQLPKSQNNFPRLVQLALKLFF